MRSPIGFAATAYRALEELTHLLDCQFSVLTFQNPVVGPGFTLVFPQEFPLLRYKPGFETFVEQHPHRRFYKLHQVEGAVQFADIISRNKLERLDLYEEFFKPLNTRHLVAQQYETIHLDSEGLELPSSGIYQYKKVHAQRSCCTFAFASGHDVRPFTVEQCGLFHRFCQTVSLFLQREMRTERAVAGMDRKASPAEEGPKAFETVVKQHRLTLAQSRVFRWVAMGKTNAEIATILGNSERTIEVHLEAILRKLGVENRVAAAAMAWSGKVC